MLEAIPATSIERVELNSIADGSQSASDSQAIINLKTNNKKLDGYYFSLGGELSFFEQGKQGGASNIFYMLKKGNILFNTSLSYSHDYESAYTKDSTYYRNNSIMLNESEDSGRTNVYVLNSNLAWEFKKGHLLNFNAFIYDDFSNKKSTQHIRTYNTLNDADYFLDMKGKGNDDLWSGSIEYSSPDTLSNRIVARYEFDYGGLRSKRDYYRGQLPYSKKEKYYYTNPEMVGYRHIGRIDFTHKDSIYGELRTGVKATIGHLDDDVITEVAEKQSSSNFTGEEKIVEGYMRYLYDITPKLGMNVAFRAERTNYDTDFNSGTDGINRTYVNYFPYFHLYYNLSKSYQTVLAYVSGILRPNYEHMLPGIRYQNDFSYTQGNPDLEPTLIRGVVWGHYLYGYGNIMFRYIRDKNIEGAVLVNTTEKVRKYTYENYADNDRFQVNAYLPFEFFQKKLSGYLEGYIRHNCLKNTKKEYLISKERNKYWQGNLQTMLNYQITESLGVNLWSSFTPSYKGFQYNYKSSWEIDLGMTYSFLKNGNGVISLSVEDIFNTYNNDRKYYYDGNTLDKQINYKDSRFIKFGLRISLNGGEKIRDKAKENINDTSRFK